MYLHEVKLQFLFLVPVQANEDKTHQERQKQEQEVYLQCKWQVSFQVSELCAVDCSWGSPELKKLQGETITESCGSALLGL